MMSGPVFLGRTVIAKKMAVLQAQRSQAIRKPEEVIVTFRTFEIDVLNTLAVF